MHRGLDVLRTLPALEAVLLLGPPAFWVAGFVLWTLVCLARRRVPRSARFEKMGRAKVVPRFVLEYGYFMLGWQVRLLMAVGLTANAVTLLSLGLAAAGGWFLAQGRFLLGGWGMLGSFFCDAYDGLIARAQGTAGPRGEYLDSFIDRYADLLPGFGFLWYYRDDATATIVVALAMMGSSAMGYARAKGEALGIDPNVGVMQRHERGVWLGCLTVTAPIFAAFLEPSETRAAFAGAGGHPRYHVALFALALVALLANVSAFLRAAYVLKRLPAPTPSPRSEAS